MNSDCGGQLGAMQSRGTCWFFTILNGFILSEDGQAILFNRLNEFYKKLKKDEKAYFDAANDAPCPLKDLTKVKQIYFWKFIDQYLCLLGGPRSIPMQAGRSAELLKNINLAGAKARLNQGGRGASGQEEICRVLDHIGFKGKYDTRYANKQSTFDGRKKPQFVVVRDSETKPRDHMYEFPSDFMAYSGYELMCCGIAIYNEEAKAAEMHRAHAIAGFVCNGKGFIFDSNQMKVFPCKWWIRSEMIRVIDDDVAPFYPYFKHGQITYYGYMFAIFARNEFTKDIRPSCRLRYKKVKTPNTNLNFTAPGLAMLLNASNMGYNPAQIAALKRKWGRTEHRTSEYVSASNVQFIVAISNKREVALKKLAALLKEGKKMNPGVVKIFNEKMDAKFPLVLRKENYNSIINSAGSYEEANKALDDLINAGYKVKNAINTAKFFKKLREKFPNSVAPLKPGQRSPSLNIINNLVKKSYYRAQAKKAIEAAIKGNKHSKYINEQLNKAFPPVKTIPPLPRLKSPTQTKINTIIEKANSRSKAHNEISAARNINNRKYYRYIQNKLNAKFPFPPARSPSQIKINAIIAMAGTRQKALENVTANKTINVAKHRNYYSQKLREKFGSPPKPKAPSPPKVAPPPKVSPKPFTFAEAKAHLNKFKGITARKRAYANVWRGLTMNQRRILIHYRNKGEWPTA